MHFHGSFLSSKTGSREVKLLNKQGLDLWLGSWPMYIQYKKLPFLVLNLNLGKLTQCKVSFNEGKIKQ